MHENAALWADDTAIEELDAQHLASTNVATAKADHGWTDPIITILDGNQPGKTATDVTISLEDAVDFMFHSSATLEPNSLTEARLRPDADKWIMAAMEEMLANQTEARALSGA